MKLVSMKREREEQEKDPVCCPSDSHYPDYPYGTRINLSDPEIESLGLTTLPASGSTVQIAGVGKVMGIREEQVDGKVQRSLEIQITDLGLDVDDGRSTSERMYPAKGSK